jgi:hypothetical protein
MAADRRNVPPNNAPQLTWHSAFQTKLWYRLALNMGASATVGGLCHTAERPVRWAAARERLMSQFEYLAIAFSLVLSLAGVRLIAGLPYAYQPDRRYWVHLCFVCWQLAVTVLIFFLFWSFHTVTWNFPTFALVLVSPGLIYFNACTLIPENPASVESWRQYFFSIRRRYFAGVICWALALGAISTVALAMPLIHQGRGLHAALLLSGVAGAISESHRVQASIAVFLLALTAFIALALGLEPDYLAPM